MSSRITPNQTRTDFNPAESIFVGVNEGETRRKGVINTSMIEGRTLSRMGGGRNTRMGLPEFTPVKNYKFLPGDPEMYNGDPVAKSLIL